MNRRRSTASSALAFMDCICCAFGAVLLLFILTAKTHRQQQHELEVISAATLAELKEALDSTQHELNKVDKALGKVPRESVQLSELIHANNQKSQIEKAIQAVESQLAALIEQQADSENHSTAAWKKPPSDPRYLADLQLTGPHIAIILESSGSMLGEDAASASAQLQKSPNNSSKWQRAKSILGALIASMPEQQKFALLSMQAETTLLSAQTTSSYNESSDGETIVKILKMIDQIEPQGGANLTSAMQAIQALNPTPSSVLLITDGLPTAPATAQSRLSESARVTLFFEAAQLCPDLNFNVLLLPFAGDPSAAGLYWKLCSQKNGICLVPASNWPANSNQLGPTI